MKRILGLLLLALTISVVGWPQNTTSYTVKGILLDSLTQEGEPYATIKIVKKSAPTKAVKMAVTGANGKFQEKLNAAAGNYVITITSIGKAPIVKEFTLKPSVQVVDLGTMFSAEATNELKGVEVVAQKPLVKVDVDKIEYNMEDDPDSKSNSVLEMLRKVPMVTVDGEDNIEVNGSSSFKVYVNGKPNNMMSNNPKEVLKSMPASSIKYIEVITSPGAKYDAEGVGGILNIVTVGSGFEGYTATFRGYVNNNGGVGGSTYGTVKQGKLTVSGNYSYNHRKNPPSYSDSYRENYESNTEKYLESTIESKTTDDFQYGNLEASYEIDTLRLLTVAFGLFGGNFRSYGDGNTVMYAADHNTPSYKYGTGNDGKNNFFSINGNVDYQRVSKKNKERMITLSYKLNTQPQTTDYYTEYKGLDPVNDAALIDRLFLRNTHTDGKTNTMEHTFQIDYTTPIGKLHTIETGAKYILRNNSSDNNLYEAKGGSNDYKYNENRSSEYRHLNHILSGYFGYTLKYKDFTLKPGVRYEQTIQRVKYIVGPGEDFNTNYNDVVPNASLGMKLGRTQSIRAGYQMRIRRPGIWYLNPYFDNQNSMAITQGNSDLKSEKSHAFDLAFSSFSAKFNINLSLRHAFTNNSIERISRLITDPAGETFDGDPQHHAPQGAMYSTYDNIGKSRGTGLSLYVNWNASPTTRISLNSTGRYADLKSEAQKLHNYGWAAFAYGSVQQTIPWKIRLSLSGGGSTPYINLQGKGSGYYYYSITLNRSFLKGDRLGINLYCNNIFEKYRRYSNTTVGTNFMSKSTNLNPSRNFGINISYRIGELKASVKKAAHSINNDDVKGGESGSSSGGEGEA